MAKTDKIVMKRCTANRDWQCYLRQTNLTMYTYKEYEIEGAKYKFGRTRPTIA
jgi:hypothetical protein